MQRDVVHWALAVSRGQARNGLLRATVGLPTLLAEALTDPRSTVNELVLEDLTFTGETESEKGPTEVSEHGLDAELAESCTETLFLNALAPRLQDLPHLEETPENQGGREPSKERGCDLLAAVSDVLLCLFYHLRENPLLCQSVVHSS